jgi:hypothetical protein
MQDFFFETKAFSYHGCPLQARHEEQVQGRGTNIRNPWPENWLTEPNSARRDHGRVRDLRPAMPSTQ